MGIAELRSLKQLEKESARLNRLIIDLSLDNNMSKEVILEMIHRLNHAGITEL